MELNDFSVLCYLINCSSLQYSQLPQSRLAQHREVALWHWARFLSVSYSRLALAEQVQKHREAAINSELSDTERDFSVLALRASLLLSRHSIEKSRSEPSIA